MKEKNVNLNGKTVLITGAAGFIGSHLAVRLLDEFDDIKVVGYDNVNESNHTCTGNHIRQRVRGTGWCITL